MDLKDKRVVVIGGSSGMGLAVARRAAERGAKVLVASRSVEKLSRAKAEIRGTIGTYPLDVTREEEVERFFSRVGALDHLVTSAAITGMGPFLETPQEKVRALFESKFWGQYRAARHAAPRIAPGGSITFFSGIAGQRPFHGFSAYAAVNGAVEGLCRALALELAPVRVNVVSPGIVDTPAYAGMDEEERRAFLDSVAKRLPAGRVGDPDDAAEAALFLMLSGFTTGTVLSVDGGGRLV